MNRLKTIGNVMTGSHGKLFSSTKGGNKEKVPLIENIKRGWDMWSLKYATDIEPMVVPSQLTLMNELRPLAGDKILEAACGSGYHGALYCMTKPEDQAYTMVDLSPEMIKLARKRIALTLEKGKFYKEAENMPPMEESKIDECLNKRNISILAHNCENLDIFKPKTFDIYLGGLFVHLVPDPDVILKEAHRLLKDGGRIGFSVFGDQESSLYFSLFDNLCKKNGHVEFRSKFHLNDEAKLRSMVEATGFKNVKIMRQDLSFGITKPEDADEHFAMPSNRSILKQFDEKKIDQMKQELRSQFAEVLKSKAIGIQNILVVATK